MGQARHERNYHIFYCLLAGLSKEHRDRLHLKDAAHYRYLAGVTQTVYCEDIPPGAGRDGAVRGTGRRGGVCRDPLRHEGDLLHC